MKNLNERTFDLLEPCKKISKDISLAAAVALRHRITTNLNSEILIINDTDDEAYGNGLAGWLMSNYHYSNLGSSFRVNLSKPIENK